MNIKETYISFTGEIDVGSYALFVVLDTDGTFILEDELAKQMVFFPKVVFEGDVASHTKEFALLHKKILKTKPNINIVLNFSSDKRPRHINGLTNITFIVDVLLESTGSNNINRVSFDAMNWFVGVGALFKFYIREIKDFKEAISIINEYSIPKNKSYFALKYDVTTEKLEKVMQYAKTNNVNISIDIKDLFWRHDGRIVK